MRIETDVQDVGSFRQSDVPKAQELIDGLIKDREVALGVADVFLRDTTVAAAIYLYGYTVNFDIYWRQIDKDITMSKITGGDQG